MITLRAIAETVRRSFAMQVRQRIAAEQIAATEAARQAEAEALREQRQLDELAAQIMRRQAKLT